MGLKNAAELRRDGDFETAEAIVEAMGCTPLKPGSSNKSLSCYDERGSKYSMPLYLFSDPSNMLENQGLMERAERVIADQKENPITNNSVSFKVRMTVGGDLEVEMNEQDTIEELKEAISKHLNYMDPSKIRILAKGKMYSDSYTLRAPFPVKDGDVIHASFPSKLYEEAMLNNAKYPSSGKESECRIRKI